MVTSLNGSPLLGRYRGYSGVIVRLYWGYIGILENEIENAI